jgi:hypothetical protein
VTKIPVLTCEICGFKFMPDQPQAMNRKTCYSDECKAERIRIGQRNARRRDKAKNDQLRDTKLPKPEPTKKRLCQLQMRTGCKVYIDNANRFHCSYCHEHSNEYVPPLPTIYNKWRHGC